jgi:transcriptional regulator with XRE-family HTH domain
MISREEIIRSKEFWLVRLQSTLYEQVEKYLKDNGITKTEFATKLGVSKGYISQILNGDYDHKLSKFIELSLAINKVPLLKLVDLEECMDFDRKGFLNSLEDNTVKVILNYNQPIKLDNNTISPFQIYSKNLLNFYKNDEYEITKFDYSSNVLA